MFIILLWKYAELKGRIEQRARQMFEEWRERELEGVSTKKAELLFEEWKQRYEKEIRRDAVEKSKAVIAGKVRNWICNSSYFTHNISLDFTFYLLNHRPE